MTSHVAPLDDAKDVKSEVLGVSFAEGATRATARARAPAIRTTRLTSSVLIGGVSVGRGIQKGKVTKRRLTAIEKANLEADEVRDRFKAQKQDPNEEEIDEEGSADVVKSLKYERRLKMNRRSAAASRVRREAYTKALEKYLGILENKTFVLQEELKAAEERRDLQRMTPSELGPALPNPAPPAGPPNPAPPAAPSLPFTGEEVEAPALDGLELPDFFFNNDLYR